MIYEFIRRTAENDRGAITGMELRISGDTAHIEDFCPGIESRASVVIAAFMHSAHAREFAESQGMQFPEGIFDCRGN